MNKLILPIVLSIFSFSSLANSCPSGSEQIKTISEDGSYYVYKCEEKSTRNTVSKSNTVNASPADPQMDLNANVKDEKPGRFFYDQPDVNDDYQIHFIYMLDKDGVDREWDINGKMEKEIHKMNEKLYQLTGDKQRFKLDMRENGELDISFVRLDKKGTKRGWNNSYPDFFIQKLGFDNPKKLYYSWVDFNHSDGGQMGLHSGYTFLLSKYNIGREDKRIKITLHELMHGNGFAWPCTTGKINSHVTGQSILSNNNWAYKLGNMIYDHNNKGCPDLKDSVYLTPTSDDPYDPLPMVCHLAERAGRAHGGAYGFGGLWPEKYNHVKFNEIKKRSYWCTYKLAEFAKDHWFREWQ